MTSNDAAAQRDTSALGCRLHDWNVGARECAASTRRRDGRGLILDLDDTLYPHEDFVRSGFMAVAHHVERTEGLAAADVFASLVTSRGSGARRAEFQALCAERDLRADRVPAMLDAFRSHHPALTLPRATVAALTKLRLDGWRLVILTNGDPAVQRRKVSALRIGALVDSVVYAEEHATGGKPGAAAFAEALRRLGVSARRAVCVGDDPSCDIGGANRLGIRTVQVMTEGTAVDPRADSALTTLEALPRIASQLLDGAVTDAA